MSNRNRRLSFKVEQLDSTERVVDELSLSLVDGKIDVADSSLMRKCSLDLLEPLPVDWQSYRWKLYYGYFDEETRQLVYEPQGVFIFINPKEEEDNGQFITSYQGIDKSKLFEDYELADPVTFASGTDVIDIIKEVAGWFGETRFNLEQHLGTLGADFTFEEGSNARQLLNTLVSSFSADWWYDVNGILTARKQSDPHTRPVSYEIDNVDEPIYISSSRDIDDGNYYNKVTVIGGKADTDIYRVTMQNNTAIALAGGRIVHRYFTIDAAVTQAQVEGRAAFYLSGGVALPSEIKLTSLVLPKLRIGDIISRDERKYEVRSFTIPLGLEAQDISARELT